MPLESATFIDGLVTTNPAVSDLVSAGDDHIRLLKSTIKASFPLIAGAVTATHTELGYLSGVSSNVQAQLNAKSGVGHTHAETDIQDGAILARVASNETITGAWNFTARPKINSNDVLDAASSIPETNIADGAIFPRLAATETITAQWNFQTAPLIASLGVLRWATAGLTSGRCFLVTAVPADTGTPGDLYFVHE